MDDTLVEVTPANLRLEAAFADRSYSIMLLDGAADRIESLTAERDKWRALAGEMAEALELVKTRDGLLDDEQIALTAYRAAEGEG